MSIHFFRLKASLGTVEDMWLKPEELAFDSDSNISEMSEIWSEYGDEATSNEQPRLTRWNPLKKNVSEKLSWKERGQEMGKKVGRKKRLEDFI